jgi:serpin B
MRVRISWATLICLGILLAAIVLSASACGTSPGAEMQVSSDSASAVLTGEPQAEPSTQAQRDMHAVAAGNNEFSFDLFRVVRSKSENLVISPYGLSVVLSMTMAGAKGETRQEMADVLHLSLAEGQLYPALGALASSLADIEDFTSASALWGQTGLNYKSDFIDLLGSTYGAPLRLVDFDNYAEAAKTINGWASKNTNGRIPELIDVNAPRPDTIIMMLTNAVYMKAEWQHPFLPEETSDRSFHLLDETTVQVPTMSLTSSLNYLSDSTLDAVELLYKDGRLSLVVLAPKTGDFENHLSKMNTETLEEALSQLEQGQVELRLPRFTVTSSPDVTKTLQAMGMRTPFASQANFSGITEAPAQISDVTQKAFILVDEEGTEAAAASGVTVAAVATTTSERIPVLSIDRPFYYLVRDNKTGTILFLGQVTDPR